MERVPFVCPCPKPDEAERIPPRSSCQMSGIRYRRPAQPPLGQWIPDQRRDDRVSLEGHALSCPQTKNGSRTDCSPASGLRPRRQGVPPKGAQGDLQGPGPSSCEARQSAGQEVPHRPWSMNASCAQSGTRGTKRPERSEPGDTGGGCRTAHPRESVK